MIKSSLYVYIDVHILVKQSITVENIEIAAVPNHRNKKVIFKNCGMFTDCVSEINNKEVDHAKDIDVVILMYNLTEYSDNYKKTFGSLWQYYRDEALIGDDCNFIDIPDDPDIASFKYKPKITSQAGNDGTSKMFK